MQPPNRPTPRGPSSRSSLSWFSLALIPAAALVGVACRAAELPAVDGGRSLFGRWQVVDRGWGWETRLHALEIRPLSTTSAESVVVAFERDERGLERVWGSARVDRPLAPPPSSRWSSAEWTIGRSTVLLQLRVGPDETLTALIRERARDRGSNPTERVRQVTLEHAPPEDRQVSNSAQVAHSAPRRRPEPEGDLGPRNEVSGVFTVGDDGRGLRSVAPPDGFRRAAYPSWSPDGRWIAFTAFDASGRDPLIRVVPARGGPTTALAAGIAPAWSHDGSRLAYIASGKTNDATDWTAIGRNDERIEIVALTGPGAGEIEVVGRGIWPRWSPTDDRLAFVARREANWDVYVRSANGLGLVRLTDYPALDTRPVWTGDGLALVFLSDRGNRWDLYKVSSDGRGPTTRLTNHRRREDDAAISPDGNRIAFTDHRSRSVSSIVVLDLTDGSVRPLLEGSLGDREPAWSPDGRSIAFVSRRPGQLPPEDIERR